MEEIDPEAQWRHFVAHAEAEMCKGFYTRREYIHSLFAALSYYGDLAYQESHLEVTLEMSFMYWSL